MHNVAMQSRSAARGLIKLFNLAGLVSSGGLQAAGGVQTALGIGLRHRM
jgi:hypothetical protein